MKFIEYAEKLKTIQHLAEYKKAGSPQQLAVKLNVSARTVERMIQQLRETGYPIKYNRFRCTYEVRM